MARYFLHRNGQTHGPYLLQQMHEYISSGEIGPRELVCEEGSSQWIPASQFTLGTTTQLRPGGPSAKAHAEGARVLRVTRDDVDRARARLKLPLMGVLFSIAVPVLFWAAKSDAERGVAASGRHAGLQQLLQQNTQLLPLAIVVGVIGAVLCGIWLFKRLAHARALQADYKRIRG